MLMTIPKYHELPGKQFEILATSKTRSLNRVTQFFFKRDTPNPFSSPFSWQRSMSTLYWITH